MQAFEALTTLRKSISLVLNLLPAQLSNSLSDVGDKLAARKGAFSDDFCGGARRGCTGIGDKIADGKIYFVSDRRDNRQGRMKDGASNNFFIECPQIFRTSAASRHEDEIQRFVIVNWQSIISRA